MVRLMRGKACLKVERWVPITLALPLALVFAINMIAVLPEPYGFEAASKGESRYPVNLDLVQVETVSLQRIDREPPGALERPFPVPQGEIEPIHLGAVQDADFGFPSSAGSRPAPAIGSEKGASRADRPESSAAISGVLPIEFDLRGGLKDDSGVQIRKAIRTAGRELGEVDLRIDNNLAIFASREQIARILPQRSRAVERMEGDFVRLSALRDVGVNLRYDATADQLVLVE